MAGIIAFALIAVFMIIIFKVPGFVLVLTLVGQLAITFAAISGYFPFVNSFMTLPGLAGIILSIGVGVDANIITASRIKEELGTGKTLDGAIQKGCSNSLWSIVDGNITILIVAIMLIGVFGPSNIEDFRRIHDRCDLLLRLHFARRRNRQLYYGRVLLSSDDQIAFRLQAAP